MRIFYTFLLIFVTQVVGCPTETLAEITSTTFVTITPSATITGAPVDLTIEITNSYGTELSLSFQVDAFSPTPLGDPQPTVLPDNAKTQYFYPTGWAGGIKVGQTINVGNSLIEGSNNNDTVSIDVSYVDGFSVPITCSSDGAPITGCNIDLFDQGIQCDDEVEGPVCLNPARSTPAGPPTCFFAACTGAAYTFPDDDNAVGTGSSLISCCIGTSCVAPSRQPGTTAACSTI